MAYYAFGFACWGAIRHRPSWTPVIGMGESSVNLFLLLLSVLGPIFAAPGIIAAGGTPEISIGPGRLVNLMLAGIVLVMSFHGHQAELTRRIRPGARAKRPNGDNPRE